VTYLRILPLHYVDPPRGKKKAPPCTPLHYVGGDLRGGAVRGTRTVLYLCQPPERVILDCTKRGKVCTLGI